MLKCAAAIGSGTPVTGRTWGLAGSRRYAARWLRRLWEDSHRGLVAPAARPDPAHWEPNRITVSWLGHSTVLLNFYGVNILTDPALGNRVGISLGLGTAGPKRYIAPALRVQELPRIDLLLLSHAHMDHMDLPTLRRLPPETFTVSASLTRDVVTAGGLKRITELKWGERTMLRNGHGEIEIEAFQVKHWGRRWPSDLARGYNGYILRREGKALLFGGDTATTGLFEEIRARGPFEAAIMPIGAYQPWIWNHCTPEQALAMADAARAKFILPVHHQTFRLSEEPMREPIERLQTALAAEPERLALREIGETFVCPET